MTMVLTEGKPDNLRRMFLVFAGSWAASGSVTMGERVPSKSRSRKTPFAFLTVAAISRR
jgi:hypothetical protein